MQHTQSPKTQIVRTTHILKVNEGETVELLKKALTSIPSNAKFLNAESVAGKESESSTGVILEFTYEIATYIPKEPKQCECSKIKSNQEWISLDQSFYSKIRCTNCGWSYAPLYEKDVDTFDSQEEYERIKYGYILPTN